MIASLHTAEATPVATTNGEPHPLEISHELARGAQARVLAAFDPSLARHVVVKELALEAHWPGWVRGRYLEEARLLAAVDHPNIVRVFSVEQTPTTLRLVLEHIEGDTLEALVRERGPFSTPEAVTIGIELCRALAAIHARGIVHCDVKPGNVMRGKNGRIVLLDFGIAVRALEGRDAGDGLAGTPLLMAPEQFEPGAIDGRADLFSLGSLLYWLVSGRFPFEGATFEAVRERVLQGSPTPLTDHVADVPPGFAAIVTRALAKRADDRFQSAGEFEAALRAFLGSPVDQRAPQGHAKTRRMRTLPTRLVLAAAALAVLGTAWFLLHRQPQRNAGIEAQLYLCSKTGNRALQTGDHVRAGDDLVLELRASVPVYAYLFSEDSEGKLLTIFPLPEYLLENPLSAGVSHLLPGSIDGEQQSLRMDEGTAKSESLLLITSPGPLAEAEELARRTPHAVKVEGAVERPEEDSDVQRGIVLGKAPRSAKQLRPSRLKEVYETVGDDTSQGAPVTTTVTKRLIQLVRD
jgi:eukaryotic-like serine/threonine-protein kinase